MAASLREPGKNGDGTGVSALVCAQEITGRATERWANVEAGLACQ